MDVAEDADLKLQRASSDLLHELETALPRFLWLDTYPISPPHHQVRRLRTIVRRSTTADLIKLLQPFQEWPQLLDPSLAHVLPLLLHAYLETLKKRPHRQQPLKRHLSAFTQTLSQAISELLYTLCKIRGAKVIVRFFNNEPTLLEPILDVIQGRTLVLLEDHDECESDESQGASKQESLPSSIIIPWEENYILLLWLSHLMLTPFDLDSISSTTTLIDGTVPEALSLPTELPSITLRLVAICVNHFDAAGKKREAAVALLVRLGLRPDMRRVGLLDALVTWASKMLISNDSICDSIYPYLGKLSFLAGVISSSDALVVQPFILPVFQCIQKINAQKTPISKSIKSSALARKIIVKILRALTVTAIQIESQPLVRPTPIITDTLLEEVVEHLLMSLADKEAPVRLAASKALSIITTKLEADMASEVIQAIIDSLEENVTWESHSPKPSDPRSKDPESDEYKLQDPSLSSVNALQWQGLILTLSHLLFRRTLRPERLSLFLNPLKTALQFEQRLSSGSSIGIPVRDAACFGMWSLARKYTTEELLNVNTSTMRAASSRDNDLSVIQVLANQLVTTACLDPSGNIRRGASAALQELVGRHPDRIIDGLTLIQIVDYHAVALRVRALSEVAFEAAKLGNLYWDVLRDGLLGWRGVASPHPVPRRQAAKAVGKLVLLRGRDGVEKSVARILKRLHQLESRDLGQKHGLLMALAAIVEETGDMFSRPIIERPDPIPSNLWEVFQPDLILREKDFTSTLSHPELTAEAACSLISALAIAVSSTKINHLYPSSDTLTHIVNLVSISLERGEDVVVDCASKAMEALFHILSNKARAKIVQSWVSKLRSEVASPIRPPNCGVGYLAALGGIFYMYKDVSPFHQEIVDTLVKQLGLETEVETRIAALKSLRRGVFACQVMTEPITRAISLNLDDYTIDQRGDVGSLVRVVAVDAVYEAYIHGLLNEPDKRHLVSQVCGLAVEKLDKVRFRGWSCLSDIWDIFGARAVRPRFRDVAETASMDYYLQMLNLTDIEWVRVPLLKGFVTSAGTGSESILRASRAALATHVLHLDQIQVTELYTALMSVLRTYYTIDRVAVATLEVFGFLISITEISRLNDWQINWHNLFVLVQRTHYKTTSVHKLTAAIGVYAGLASIRELEGKVSLKLVQMLLHPYPQIRNAAADELFMIGRDSAVDQINWSLSAKELKPHVLQIEESYHRGFSKV